ncbi:matrixin family metalloprotease [Bradyrhizobium sp.]|uniref:matrixin family metalloprotease n=1 Tax=Bradyrhizobium sp. TaxID=376 RepID=UPI002DDCB114|nr:matrixin family metalloprotease [Bradyrhizobium sp.]HEV2160458.1 matrixin family metalloprotease [Bradyrhizobium sp.]
MSLLAFVVTASIGRADVLRGSSGAAYVSILAMDRIAIRYFEGCSGAEERSIPWSEVESVTFEPSCGSAIAEATLAAPDCPDGSLDVFVVDLGGQATPVVAESVAITADRTVHLDTFHPWEQAHGPVSTVRSIARRKICRNRIPESYELPSSFCHEGRQVAVAFDYRAPLSNKILTNGFSFILQPVGPIPDGFDVDAFGAEVRNAFQSGISLWMSSVKDMEARLSPDLRKFLDGRTSRSPNGYQLFIPPQVIRLACPQSATFVVELGFDDLELFPKFPLVLARAKIEGRTIALNMRAFKCFRSQLKFGPDKRLSFELDDGCINLVPIMAHELGHAFGLNHVDNETTHALMDSQFSRDALVPTERDTLALATILEESIVGAAPGVLKFVSSSGVRPPADWKDSPPN